jgi:hypothetical protein
MNWYAAHIIMYVKLKDAPQDRYSMWENIVLISAESSDEAYAKAEQQGRDDVGDDDSFRHDGKPAEWVFAGVRKVTLCQDPKERPGDGTEVSYLELEAASLDELTKLVRGEPATVEICDGFPDDEDLEVSPACR